MKKLDVGKNVWVIYKHLKIGAKFGEPMIWELKYNTKVKIIDTYCEDNINYYNVEEPMNNISGRYELAYTIDRLYTSKEDAVEACKIRNREMLNARDNLCIEIER